MINLTVYNTVCRVVSEREKEEGQGESENDGICRQRIQKAAVRQLPVSAHSNISEKVKSQFLASISVYLLF